MILRERPSGWRLFFVLRGSVAPKVAPQVLGSVLLALVVSRTHGVLFDHSLAFTAAPFTIIGLALSIFLGFRNTTAYARYWEGRILWGELRIACRVLARQMESLLAPGEGEAALRRRMAWRAIGFAHALRHRLRGTDPAAELAPLLPPAELEAALRSGNPPGAILRAMGRELGACLRERRVDGPLAARIDETLTAFDRVLAGCDRIRGTPIPFSYTLLLHRTAYLYCFMLPFGLVDTVGLATPVMVGLVSYTFFGLDALGDEIEEPFGTLPNDLPLTALCRAIEIELREALGEPDLPPPLQPRNYVLE
ncbi:bestrophin family protein [Paracraurococcus lichenis]|uniref:Bestrophin family ion channel n=1 Tax=Paracraurococcus lichenis TaxID=3064888 RepID=A0ABT9DSA6_9PROT|nr:bestrophin family ion channel [Paracraurococcus sp. LOR1-02]MDO9706779.1 bestrophin family ion channel [Paracraurococcus sp. LOR1-02]